MIGIDVIPAQPPKGVSTIQGNFLSAAVQTEVKNFLRDPSRGMVLPQQFLAGGSMNVETRPRTDFADPLSADFQQTTKRAWDPLGIHKKLISDESGMVDTIGQDESMVVDVVLSDMSEPWDQTSGFWKRSLSDPYYRMVNTSGNAFRDHAGSMVCSLIVSPV